MADDELIRVPGRGRLRTIFSLAPEEASGV